MLGHRTTVVARRAIVIGAAGVVAGLLGSGIASADVAVDQFLNWNGNFPIIGNLDPISTETITSLPSPVTVGTASSSFPVSVKIDAPPLATTGLEDVGAASVSGTAQVVVEATDSAGKTADQTVNLTIPSTPTPPSGSDFVVTATGTTSIPAIADAGNVVLKVVSANTTLTPVDSSGNPTIVGTFTVDLSLDATGPSQNPTNDTTLGTIVAQ
jgi:hypothetical protein